MWTIVHSWAIVVWLDGAAIGAVCVPNIVQKSAGSDQNIEGSTDYAQKNDDADHMSGSGKMVILREGGCRLMGRRRRKAVALSGGT